jgi:hypothetical protein
MSLGYIGHIGHLYIPPASKKGNKEPGHRVRVRTYLPTLFFAGEHVVRLARKR